MEGFLKKISDRLKVSMAIIDAPIKLNRTRIELDIEGDVILGINAYMD